MKKISTTKKNKLTMRKLIAVAAVSALAAVTTLGFAACKDEEIVFTFNTDGGTDIENVKLDKGEEYDLPIPEKAGYEFEGWYTNSNFEGDPVTKIVANESTTLYAKWTQLAVITLDLDGGSLAQTTLYLKAGQNLLEFMQSYVPTKDGLVFGAWFNGNVELGANTTMPAAGITLKARYKVAYTAKIFLQKYDLSGYEAGEDIVSYGYVGMPLESAPEITGFSEVVTDDTVSYAAALSKNASENVFVHYFDRETYTVVFNTNYPVAGMESETTSNFVRYGTEIDVPNNYTCEGYCLIGWAASSNATEVLYNARCLESALYNKEEGTVTTPDKFKPESNTTLYAVWAKGYQDLFGGNDYIYLLGEEVTAYLCRGKVFFEGDYNAKLNEVYFGDLVGKLYENNTFSYYNDGKVFTLRQGDGLDKQTTLTLVNNTATYTKNGEKSEGTFVRTGEEDCFEITYTTGSLAGQSMVVKTRIVSVTDEEGKTSNQAVFNIRNDEEVALGAETDGLVRVMLSSSGSVGTYYPIIKFDGFGVATLTTASEESTYYYSIEDSILTLSSSEGGSAALTACITDINGVQVYVLYEQWLDQSFTLASGDVLTLDGGLKATYSVGGVEKEGYYSVAESQFGTLITVYAKETYKFLIKTEKDQASGSEGATTYVVESKPSSYAEYRYVKDGSVYYAPLLVVDETEVGKATLYAQRGETTEYVKVSVGSYTLVDDFYVYVAEEDFDAEGLNDKPFDLTQIQSIVFQVNASATEYSLMYWKSYTTKDEAVVTDLVEYTLKTNERDTLKLIGGFAILKVMGASTFVGPYIVKDGLTTIINGNQYRYVELHEDHTFTLLEYAPYQAYMLTENDAVNDMEYVNFDGKGNATYVKVITKAEGENPAVTESTEGTTTDTKETTLSGEKIYLFTSNDGTLSFKYINVPETNYIVRFNEVYNGRYAAADYGVLTLDGFGYKAEYNSFENDKTYVGLYTVIAENEIAFYSEEMERTIYFDLKTGKSFTLRADEFGSYLLVDNQNIQAYIDLDGYGKATIFTVEKQGDEEVKIYIDENATYEKNGSVFTLSYKDGSELITVEAKLGTLTLSGTAYNAVLVVNREAVRVYVNEDDWSVLILDDVGNAVKYNEEGVREEGNYLLITENFLYYTNVELTDACVYEYDVEKGTATPVKFDRRSYYTSDLERLLFSEYGYAYFGNTRYYYHEDAQGNVLLYRYATEGETPNQYGFVEDTTFGSFAGDVKEYGGKTYYKSSGFGINLDRLAATKDYYPVATSNNSQKKYALETLTFNPGADEEYISQGSVNLNGQSYDCYVIRERNAETGDLELYVSLGYYRFYIDVTYNGTNNTYEVTRLEYKRSLYSYNYLYYYFLTAIYFSSSLDDTFGMVHICANYAEDGTIIEEYITGDFLKDSKIVDENGNVITFAKAEYSYNRGIYGATFTAEDGYTYTLYFGLQYQSMMGRYGYTVAALARHEVLTTDNGYEVTVERIVYTELTTIEVGSIYTLSLKKNGELLPTEALISVGGSIYFIVREREEGTDGKLGKVISTKYYQLTLEEENPEDYVGDEDKSRVPFYVAATITEESVDTYYMENGVVYVDISATRGVTYVVMSDTVYVAKESTYDEESKTYTVKMTDGSTYLVKMLEGGLVVLERVSENA